MTSGWGNGTNGFFYWQKGCVFCCCPWGPNSGRCIWVNNNSSGNWALISIQGSCKHQRTTYVLPPNAPHTHLPCSQSRCQVPPPTHTRTNARTHTKTIYSGFPLKSHHTHAHRPEHRQRYRVSGSSLQTILTPRAEFYTPLYEPRRRAAAAASHSGTSFIHIPATSWWLLRPRSAWLGINRPRPWSWRR